MWPRWVRFLSTLWVALDSKKRSSLDFSWVIIILLFGPLLLPFYIVSRPLLKGEKRPDCFAWNFLVACEKMFIWMASLAAGAVFLENVTTPKSKDIAEVKRAEIKAGSVLGIVLFIIAIGLEKFGFEELKKYIEKKYFNL